MRESVSPERTTLVHLFADFVRNSGDFPTRLWVTPIGLNTDRYPNFLAGGMNAYNGDVGGEARTLCTKLGRSDFNRTPGDKWDEYQVSVYLFVLILFDLYHIRSNTYGG